MIEVMTLVRYYDLMFDLECDDLNLQMFQFLFNIRKHHLDIVITHM